MRKFERWLSVLMCICMLCTSMLSPTQLVYAEEALVEAAEIVAEEEGVDAPESVGAEISDEAETATPAGAEEPEAEPVMLAEADEPEAEIAAAEVQDAEETKVPESGQSEESGETAEDGSAENEAETEVTVEPIEKPDSIHPVVENTEEPAAQAFEFGYAKMTDDELLYEKYSDRTDEIGEVKRGGIVLVIAHRMEDDGSRARVQVNFACENEAVEGWLDAGSIEPLTEEEIEAFIEEIDEKAAEDETFVPVFYQGNEDFPLPVPAFESAETETAAASQAVMTLSAESVEIRIGETAAILPVFSDGVSREVSYAVGSEGIAAVDEAGIVSALSVGETAITVFCAELNASASAQVKVVEASAPAQITVEPASLEMLVGDAVKLAYTLSEGAEGAVEFALSAENIVSVDAEGNVVAIGEGSCVITASLVSGGEPLASAQVPVNVYALTNGIQISAQDEADVGDAVVLSVDVPDAFKSRIEYSSSDENIASVGEDGVVSAKAPGVCTLTVSLGDVKAEHVLTVYDAPEDFEFTVSDAVLNVGETAQLSVVLPEFTRGDATYAVSNPLAVGVDAKGLVMAIGPGKCEVTATVAGVSKSLTVEVYGAPTELPLKLESDTLVVGYHMQAAVELSEYVIADVVISSSNTDVAWVDENGVVTAVAPGTCEIIAKSGSLTKSCGLTVVSSALELNTKYINLAVGESFTLNYRITEEVLASETPVFSSSNESAVSVDPVSGAVEAVGEGKAVINVLLNKSGVTAQCFVSVHKAPTTILVIDAHTTVGVGQITPPIDYLLMAGSDSTIGSVTFSSSNPSVLQVNTRGQMKGIRAGTATVSIIAFNKASVDFKVTVLNAPTRLTLGAAAMTLAVGQSGKISYSLNSKTAAGMTFISSDESVATVDPKGNVTATGVGKATITVSTHNGLQKTCTINVSKAPENVTLKQTEFKLGVDMTAAVSPVVDTSSDVKFTYEFWTDAPDIISLNEKTGEIKALSVGTANVFVRAYNGVSTHEAEGERVATAAVVNVVPKPDHVTIDGTEFNIIAGKIIKLPVKMTMENGSEDCLTTYTLTSSSTKYVAVNSAGQVKGVKAGSATVTLTAGNGDVVTCKVVVRAAPRKVVLNKSSIVLGEGMKNAELAVRVYYSSSKYFTYSYEDSLGTGSFSSSNPAAATVDAATGEITAVAKGETVITFTTLNGKKASCKVTVKGTPTVIDMDRDEMKLGVDMTDTLKAVFLPDEMGNVSYSSSDETIAKVEESTGKVTGVGVGEAIITIDAGNGVTNTCKVNVVPKPDHVTIDGTEFNIIAGKIIKLPVKMTMENGSEDCLTTYTLTSSSTKYVAVNSAGQVKGVKAGSATVTLTAGNGDVVTCKVVVRAAPRKVVLNKSSIVLGEGMKNAELAVRVYYSSSKYFTYSYEDSLGTGSFSSSNPAAATVDAATGEITAVAKGETVITFTTLNGKKASCKVTVKGTPTVIDMDRDEMKLGVDMSDTLKAVFLPDELGKVSYSSSDETIAAVDANSGKVTGVGVGEAIITIDAGNGVTNTCKVKVVPKPDHVTIDGTEFNIIAGKIIKLPVKMTMENGSEDCLTTYTLTSSSTKYVAVNSAGQVKGVKAGSATVTLTAGNGDVVTCKVVVRAAPRKVVLNKSSIVLGEGMKNAELAVRVYYSSSKYFTYSYEDCLGTGSFSSSNPAAATVDAATGEITAIAKGETVITFTTLNGKKASCKVTVKGTPTVIDMDRDEMKLGVDMSDTLKAVFLPDELGNVSYSSSDEAIAVVDANSGKVTGVGVGEAVITIDAGNGVTNTCKVNVVPKPDHVTIDGTEFNIIAGKIIKLPVKMTMENGSEDCLTTYTLTSSSTKYVAVNSAGQVKGVKAGSATVTLTAGNGDVVTCKVVVRAAPRKVVLDKSSLTLGVGMDSGLAVRVYYSSSKYFNYSREDAPGVGTFRSVDPSIVEVDPATGVMKAVSKGTTTVGFETLNGKYATCRVTVVDAPTSMELSRTEMSVGELLTASLSVKFNEGELGWIKYSSSDESVATVDGSGKVTGVKAGEATITALTLNGVKAECLVHVVHAPDSVKLNMDSSNMAIGGKIALEAICTYQGTDDCLAALTWKTSNSKVATVTADGVVKGVRAGSATIRAVAQNGEYADCTVVVRNKPTKVQFAAASVSVGVGQKVNVPAKVFFSGGSCDFSINDSSYARISVDDTTVARIDPATGDVIGVDVGRTYIRLTTYNGKKAACGIVVAPGPEWISFSHAILTMSEGETQSMNCELSPGSITRLTYTSSNPGVVSVSGADENCILTAHAQGSATITAVSANGRKTSCEVTVMAKPDRIEFAKSSISVGLEDTARLPEVTVTSESGECSQIVAYEIEGTAVAMVTPGYVTGVEPGTAIVRARIGDLYAECTVVVLPKPTIVSVIPERSAIAVGDSMMLKVEMDAAGGYFFTVEDEDILTVSEDGEVTALNPGSTKITVETYNGCTGSCEITVLPVAHWVKLDVESVKIAEGAAFGLNASIPENTLGSLIWFSSDETIAKVDNTGVITALKAGKASVYVRVDGFDEAFDICEVTVLAKPESIQLSAETLRLRNGTSAQLTAECVRSDAAECYGAMVFESSDGNVAAVDGNGVITAKAAGTAVITVSLDSDSAVHAACEVTVYESRVGFAFDSIVMSVGETCALNVSLPAGEDQFSLMNSGGSVVKVNASSRTVTALAAGTATITAVNGGDTATCVITVTQKPESIVIPAEMKLAVGKSFALNAKLLPEGTAAKLTYTSTNEAVAKVSADGIVELTGVGEAVIRAANFDASLTAECIVKAVHAPETIRFGELSDIVIAVGDSYVLETPVIHNENGDCEAEYTLAVSNPDVVSVTAEGGRYVIRALKQGIATLRLKTDNGRTAMHTVLVEEVPESIAFEQATIRMAAGERFAPVLRGSNGAVVAAELTSSNDQVAAVDENGVLTAIAEGEATIMAVARSFPELSALVRIEVVKAPEVMAINAGSGMLALGEQIHLTAEFADGTASASVTYVSGDESILRTGSNGSVLAVGEGEATITATAFGGAQASCTLKVMKAPTEMHVSHASITACVRDQVQLSAVFADDTEFANLSYESDDTDVANVSASGLVTFAGTGETVIRVLTFNGLEAEIPVTVCDTPSSVAFGLADAVILKGDSAKLNIVFDQGAGYYTLTSSKPGIVSIGEDAVVTALETGSAVISLEMPALRLKAACTVRVVNALEGIEMTVEKSTLELHEQIQPIYSLKPDNAIGTGLVTFSSSDDSVAKVDPVTGVVTGEAYGTAVITASTGDGKTDAVEINVLGGKRRMLVAYYFGETGDPGYLPFAYNNGYSMTQTFSAATVEGQQYDIAGPYSNASRSTLFGAIESHFADATDDDVSILYICAHGSGSYGPTGEYAFSLDNTHHVMASELMSRLERIKGRVILIMDSCYSGGIIDCNKSRLDAQDGRISILASSHRNTNSCYWNVSQKLTSVDFFTHALLQGVGFNESQGIGGDRGWFRTDGGPADDAGNGDGLVTVSELFSYAKSTTLANLAKYKGRPEFHGNPAQTPQSYIGEMNEDLVLFSR